ncbi:hypothetical protein [Arthrobacter gengyunqii]|uniref:Asp23/Gls24 family envelope stress response protein n=1 Tax=Arthrobacter gengyunqii TaxID=2886940 RepID=A0ABS8GHQ7_9MICC|nr:hypothetical protein [Arthrobacter gengyunqii]MCC3265986.1 hypothetical protein [Arthrobacter gengyunqii]
MALENRLYRLDCGRTVNRIWQDMFRPPDPHTRSCPDCQTVRAEMEGLFNATAALRNHDLRQPGLRPPAGLKERVLDAAFSQVRRGPRFSLESAPGGTVEVSETALAAVVRGAARGIGGVRARRCRIGRVEGGDSGLLIHLRTAVAPGVDICAAMAFLRLNIRDAVEASVGVVPQTVHLTVEDLYDD